MSLAPPLPFTYQGQGVFHALPHAVAGCAEHYSQGEIVRLAPVEERSEISHRHEFAWLRDAWQTLPDAIMADYPSAEHLRKRALIATGWADIRDYPCASRAEATRLAAALRGELDDYAVVIVRDAVVRVARAKSQARDKMNRADFQASKQAVIEYVAGLLDVSPHSFTEPTMPIRFTPTDTSASICAIGQQLRF